MVTLRAFPGLAVAVLLAACGSTSGSLEANAQAKAEGDTPRSLAGSGQTEEDRGRCDTDAPDRETSEYDTDGDDRPDVRKVFLRRGDPPNTTLVLICREADLNGDGTKDVVRYYNDDGRPMREEADRNFNGQIDEISYYEDGRTIRKELDNSGNGRVDAKVYYEDGRPVRAELDIEGRSSGQQWRPDRWEYYEDGRLVRMGTDVDGDGRVDRWDRNEALRKKLEKDGEGKGDESPDPADVAGGVAGDGSAEPDGAEG